jgi:putative sigma-54 modulation protein
MKFNIRGKNIDVTDGIKQHTEDKLSKLDKYLDRPEAVEAQVLIRVYNNLQKVEITIPVRKYTLRIEEVHEDLYTAIDHAVNKLERQIRKHKTKIERRYRDVVEHDFSFDYEIKDEEISEEEVVKVKKLDVKPMDIDEAILQMELLGHDFYVFFDVDIDGVSVVYKRNDGAYGLLETR